MAGDLQKRLFQAIDYLAPDAMGGLLSFIRGMEPVWDEGIPTAQIRWSGSSFRIHFNPKFVEEHAKTTGRFAGILLHEVLHNLFAHQHYGQGEIWNIACDAFINAFITRLNPRLADVFTSYYPPDQLPLSLLRPGSRVEIPILRTLYRRLYKDLESLTVPDIVSTLQLFQDKMPSLSSLTLVLMGGHPLGQEVGSGVEGEDLLRQAAELGKVFGKKAGMESSPFWQQICNIRAKFDDTFEQAVQRALVESLKGRIVQSLVSEEDFDTSVIPQQRLGRTERVFLCAGWCSPFYTIPMSDESSEAVRIYVDVSGSVWHFREFMYSVVLGVERYLPPEVYLFSTQVKAITKEQLKNGQGTSWGGTSFDCIVEHLRENPVEKALIFTDGEADCSEENLSYIRQAGLTLTGVLTEKNPESPINEMCKWVFTLPPSLAGQGGAA